jgi:hypothetical protein
MWNDPEFVPRLYVQREMFGNVACRDFAMHDDRVRCAEHGSTHPPIQARESAVVIHPVMERPNDFYPEQSEKSDLQKKQEGGDERSN